MAFLMKVQKYTGVVVFISDLFVCTRWILLVVKRSKLELLNTGL